METYFYKRASAYLIDIILITILVSVVGGIFNLSIPTALSEEYSNLNNSFLNMEIDQKEFIKQSGEIQYNISYLTIPRTIIQIFITILLFGVFPFYNEGQTIGKKLLNIKIDKKDATIDTYIIRAMINTTLLLNIILVVAVMFLNSIDYTILSVGLNVIYLVVMAISIGMAMFSKSTKTIHDHICKTKVIRGDK